LGITALNVYWRLTWGGYNTLWLDGFHEPLLPHLMVYFRKVRIVCTWTGTLKNYGFILFLFHPVLLLNLLFIFVVKVVRKTKKNVKTSFRIIAFTK
jgi:hypothetical protein